MVAIIMQIIVLTAWHSSLSWKERWVCHLELLLVCYLRMQSVHKHYVWLYGVGKEWTRQTIWATAEFEESTQACPPLPWVNLSTVMQKRPGCAALIMWLKTLFLFILIPCITLNALWRLPDDCNCIEFIMQLFCYRESWQIGFPPIFSHRNSEQ